MRILVFSDLHSNIENLLDIQKQEIYDRLIFAGDFFGYFPFNNEILDFIKQINMNFVLGNHDLYFLRELNPEIFYKRFITLNELMLSSNDYDNKYGTLNATLNKRSQIDLDIFDNSDLSKRVKIDDIDILICHGSPNNPFDDYIYPDYEEFNELFDKYTYDVLILGHTHKQFVKEKNGRFIINPGSCTLPRGNNKPSYAIINTYPLNISIYEMDQKIKYKKITNTKIELI